MIEQLDLEVLQSSLHHLGLSGRPVVVHASLRSFGPIDGGAATLLKALLELDCTVLVPTFTSIFEVAPPDPSPYDRNGLDPSESPSPRSSRRRYDAALIDVNDDMGVLPRLVLQDSRHLRGGHPLNSFSSIGPLAPFLVSPLDSADVYRPLRNLIDRGGAVALMGVGYWSMTLLHLAEMGSGRRLFRRWALDEARRVAEFEVGSCSRGFGAFRECLDPLAVRVRVGASSWRVLDAKEAYERARLEILANPGVTQCDDDGCRRCLDQAAGGPTRRESVG